MGNPKSQVCRNPGGSLEWLSNMIITVVIATFINDYHIPSGLYSSLRLKRSIVTSLCIITTLFVALVSSGFLPAYTEDTARAVNS